MGVNSYTETECETCGDVERETGSHGFIHTGWAYIKIIQRLKGDGWQHTEHLLDKIICPDCAAKILNFIANIGYKGKHDADTN